MAHLKGCLALLLEIEAWRLVLAWVSRRVALGFVDAAGVRRVSDFLRRIFDGAVVNNRRSRRSILRPPPY